MDSYKIIRFVSKITTRLFVVDLNQSHHCRLQNQLLNTTRSFSSSLNQPQPNVTASYLINSCGLSSEEANLASTKVSLRHPEKADSILALLRNHGFSQTQISKVVRNRPRLIQADPEKTLLPKLEYLISCGLSFEDLSRTLASNPAIFEMSLEKTIMPSYSFLRSSVPSDKIVLTILNNNSWILSKDLSKNVVPNIQLLRELGMPKSVIPMLLANFRRIAHNHDKFAQAALEVKEMGFTMKDSLSFHAITALCCKYTFNKSRLAYMKCGWSEDAIRSAFLKNPRCMLISEEKIMKLMDFVVNKMGWPAQMVATDPWILCYSVEKRIVPRCSVVKVLLLKGLVNEDYKRFTFVYTYPEKQFLEKFVTGFIREVPQLLNVYQGKVNIQDA